MTRELDEWLTNRFPNLYRQRGGDLRSTAMCWGFEHGDGWFQIIYNLSEELEAEILKLPESEREYTCASQVKEKYGTLRFYMHSETQEMSYLIQEAEDKSAVTCEACGDPGELRGYGWLSTKCNECAGDQPTYAEACKEMAWKEGKGYKKSLYHRLYFIIRWFQYPGISFNSLKQDIKWKLWKLKRYVQRNTT